MSKASIHSNFAVDGSGKPLASASVTVNKETLTGGFTGLASIYSDPTLVTPLANPFTADSLGNYTFYAAPGFYGINVAANGTSINYSTLLAPLTPNGTVSADEYSGASVSAQIDAAITDLAGAHGVVIIPASMGAGWPLNGVPMNAPIWDMRGNGGSTQVAFVNGTSLYERVTAVGTGLQIPSTILIEHDAYSGGVCQFPGGVATKTQFQAIRIQLLGRTIGEKKGIEINVTNPAKGDNIGIMASTYDFGGYLTGGDEGSEGGRFMSVQGDGSTGGSFPTGTVASVSTNLVTGTWTSGTNANLGEQRPLINTSRGVYNTGTLVSGSGTAPNTIVGTGTAWSTLGTGAKTDLFLEVASLTQGTTKFVVPILSIVDDTHLTIEYNIAEIGASTLNPSGSYNIFKGGIVSSLAAPPSGSLNAASVNLVSGGSNFVAGDTIQQPLGYNYHGCGVQVAVQSILAPTQGSAGIKINNTGTVNFGDGLFINGPFNNLIRTGSVITDSVINVSTTYGCFLKASDTSSIVQTVIQLLNASSAVRSISYDRPNDMWHIGNALFVNGADTRISTNSNPQANTQFYLGYNNAAYSGLVIGPVTAPSSNLVKPLDVRKASDGTTVFAVEKDRVVLGNGLDLKAFSDNAETTVTWQILGTGAATFTQTVTATLGVANSGDNIMSAFPWTNVIAGTNNDVTDNHAPVSRITAPAGNFSITGINPASNTASTDGLLRELYNATAFTMTIKHENAGSSAANRITSPTGTDIVCKSVRMVYNTTLSRWIVLSYSPDRLYAQGSTLVAGDIALGAGWGSTASISNLVGHDGAFSFTVTANGTGLAANPTLTVTYHDGTWTNTPIAIAAITDTNTGNIAAPVKAIPTATTVAISPNIGTPTAGNSFTFSVITVGR